MIMEINKAKYKDQPNRIIEELMHGLSTIQYDFVSCFERRMEKIDQHAIVVWKDIFRKYNETIWTPLELLLPDKVVSKFFTEKREDYISMIKETLKPGMKEFSIWYEEQMREAIVQSEHYIQNECAYLEKQICLSCEMAGIDINVHSIFTSNIRDIIISNRKDVFCEENVRYVTTRKIDSFIALNSILMIDLEMAFCKPVQRISRLRITLQEISSIMGEDLKYYIEAAHKEYLKEAKQFLETQSNDLVKAFEKELTQQ